MIAYNEYTCSGKKAAAKANHQFVVKFISTEMQKCEILGCIELKTKPWTPSKVSNVTCDSAGQTTRDMALTFKVHFKIIGFKNLFNSKEKGTAYDLSRNYIQS